MKSEIVRDIHSLYLPFRKSVMDVLGLANKNINGVFIEPFETLRTRQRQSELLGEGHSLAKISKHELGLAVDLWFSKNDGSWPGSAELDSWKHWNVLGEIGEYYGLTWGGRFKKIVNGIETPWPDNCHFEYKILEKTDYENIKLLYLEKGHKEVWKYLDERGCK